MMIYCTQKLWNEFVLHRGVQHSFNDEGNMGREGWYANVFDVDTKRYCICMQAQTLFSFIISTEGEARQEDFETIWNEGLHHALIWTYGDSIHKVLPMVQCDTISGFVKATNQKGLGHLSSLQQCYKLFLEEGKILEDAVYRVNHMPQKYLGWQLPAEVMV